MDSRQHPGQPALSQNLCFRALVFVVAACSATAFAAEQTPPAQPDAGTSTGLPQQRWQWQAVPSNGTIPWPQAFAFSEILPVNERVLPGRWLSLTPRDAAWLPAFYDTVDQRLVSLAPAAQTLCNGVTVGRVVKALHARESGLEIQVRYTMQFANGNRRTSGGSGQLDATGHWSRYPFGTTMPRPEGCPSVDAIDPPPPPVTLEIPPIRPELDTLEQVSVLGQPALRERSTGRWLTPAPSGDPVIAQWQTHRLIASESPAITGYGLIDAAGELVVPTIFGSLSDVRPDATLHAELVREGNLRHQESPQLRLPPAKSFAKGFRTAQDSSGKWGYRGREGRWRVQPRFDSARPFVNGYAVVSGAMPVGWHPAHADPALSGQPLVRSIMRLGHAWVIGVSPPVAMPGSTPLPGGRAVMDGNGRWLVPVAREQATN
ncbi:MAG: WG repeat-containing protein [Comamonadaceae bacterium]|nr:MAG: WG repeat-containing protein [Comamonadaceae bacterium]